MGIYGNIITKKNDLIEEESTFDINSQSIEVQLEYYRELVSLYENSEVLFENTDESITEGFNHDIRQEWIDIKDELKGNKKKVERLMKDGEYKKALKIVDETIKVAKKAKDNINNMDYTTARNIGSYLLYVAKCMMFWPAALISNVLIPAKQVERDNKQVKKGELTTAAKWNTTRRVYINKIETFIEKLESLKKQIENKMKEKK